MNLRLEYKSLEHPGWDEPSSKYEKWAEIKLVLYDDQNQLVKVVLDWQWDILVLLDWVKENKEALLNERIPAALEGSSIAKGIFEFYENLDPDRDSEDLIDIVYYYRTRHGLRFALRGTDIEDVYIGLLNDVLTISLYKDDENQWSFDITANDFIRDIEYALMEILG